VELGATILQRCKTRNSTPQIERKQNMETTQTVSETVVITVSPKLAKAVAEYVSDETSLEGKLWGAIDALRDQATIEKLGKKQATNLLFLAFEEADKLRKAEIEAQNEKLQKLGKPLKKLPSGNRAGLVSSMVTYAGISVQDEDKAKKIEAVRNSGIGFNTGLAIVRSAEITLDDVNNGKAQEMVKAEKASRAAGGKTDPTKIASTPTSQPEKEVKPENPVAWLRNQAMSLCNKARFYGLDEEQIQEALNEGRALK
jgi:hypothetical protein